MYFLFVFVSSCRQNQYGETNKTIVKVGTVKATGTHVHLTFRENAQLSLYIAFQLRGFIDADPSKK